MKKIVIVAATAVLTLAACASEPVHTKDDAMSAIAAAKQETKRANAVNYEWRDTGKLIKKAEQAMKQGKLADAIKLANKAKRQSANALAQYEANRNAGPRLDQ